MPDRPVSRFQSADRELVSEAAQGDQQALRKLYDRYAETLYAVAYRILGDRPDTEDVVLETFAQAWRQAFKFDPARGSVAVWLTMIARSRALDLLRARRRRSQAGEEAAREVSGTPPMMGTLRNDPGRAVEQSEQQRLVQQALGGLPPEQRTAIELAFYEGLSQSEIATRLNQPLGTVKTRIRSGMQKLRDTLRPLYQDRLG